MKFFDAIHTRTPAPIPGLTPFVCVYGGEIVADNPNYPIDLGKLARRLQQIPDTVEVCVDWEWDARWPQFFRWWGSKSDMIRARAVVQDITNTAAMVRSNPVTIYGLPLPVSAYAKWQPDRLALWRRQCGEMARLGFGDDLGAVVIDGSPQHTDEIAYLPSMEFDLDERARVYPGMSARVWLDPLSTPLVLLDSILTLCKARKADVILWVPWQDDDNDGRWHPREFDPAWPWVEVVGRHMA